MSTAPSLSRPTHRRNVFIAGAILVLAALAAYHNSFSGPLVYDDIPAIKDNPTIRQLWPLSTVLSPPNDSGITVNGLRAAVTWTSLSNWSLSIPLPGNVNLLALQGLDARGNPLTNYLDTITVTNTVQPALLSVVFNEWMAANTVTFTDNMLDTVLPQKQIDYEFDGTLENVAPLAGRVVFGGHQCRQAHGK